MARDQLAGPTRAVGVTAPPEHARPRAMTRSNRTDRPRLSGRFDVNRVAVAMMFGAAIAVGTLAPFFQTYVNADVSWILHGAGRILDGAVPYRDFIETNPPLIYYLVLPAVWLARSIGASPTGLFMAMVAALSVGSIAASAVITQRSLFTDHPSARTAILFALTFMLLPFSYRLFGQREHLMIALVLPYLFSAARRAAGDPLPAGGALLVGISAGIGIAIKPFFVIPWIAMELGVGAMARRPSMVLCPETAAIGAIQVGYVAMIVLAFPDYLFTVMPLLVSYFNVHNLPPGVLVLRATMSMFPVALLLSIAVGNRAVAAPVRNLMLIAAAAFVAVFLVQQKGWEYQLLPAFTLSVALAAGLIGSLTDSPRTSTVPATRRPLVGLAGLALAVYVLGILVGPPLMPRTFFFRLDRPGYVEVLDRLRSVVATHAPGRPIYVLSASILPAYHLIGWERATWPYRMPSLWPLPGLYRGSGTGVSAGYRPKNAVPPAERYVFETVVSDLAARPPDVLIVDAGTPKHGWIQPDHGAIQFDYLAYFGQDPRFAELMTRYEELAPVARYRVFRLHEPGTR
jgi:hypothetical protein